MKHQDYILYLEDDEIDAIKFSATLMNLDFAEKIVIRENGESGIQWLKDNKNWLPKIIVLDLNMPKMDGLQFLEYIKKDNDYKKIPVIVLTSSEEKMDIQNSFKYQVAGYMVKPFSEKEYTNIVSIIKKYWDHSAIGHL